MLAAVEEVGDVDAEVIDLRWLDRASIDWDTIGASIRKTNRVLIAEQGALGTSYGGWLADEIQRRFFDWLDRPVQRVTGGEASPSISKVLERAAIAQRPRSPPAALGRDREVLRWPGCCGCPRSPPTRPRRCCRSGWSRRTPIRRRRRDRHGRDREGRSSTSRPTPPGVLLKTLVAAGCDGRGRRADRACSAAPGEAVDDLDAALAELGVAALPTRPAPERPRRDRSRLPESAARPSEPADAAAAGPDAGRRTAGADLRQPAGPAARPGARAGPRGPRRDRARRPDRPPRRRRAARSPPDGRRVRAAPSAGRRQAAGAPARRPSGGYEDIPHSRMRRAIAARLTESKHDGAALLRPRHRPGRRAARAAGASSTPAATTAGLGQRPGRQGGRAGPPAGAGDERDLDPGRRPPFATRRRRRRRRHRPRPGHPGAARRRAP